MKIYKFCYNINKDDILASKVSKEIFDTVSGNMGNNTYKEISVDNNCKLQLNTFNSIQGKLRYDTFDVHFYFDYSQTDIYPPEIHAQLKLSNEFSHQDFNRLYNAILDATKHELGHYFQYKNERDILENPENPVAHDFLEACLNTRNYLLSQNELIPFIE